MQLHLLVWVLGPSIPYLSGHPDPIQLAICLSLVTLTGVGIALSRRLAVPALAVTLGVVTPAWSSAQHPASDTPSFSAAKLALLSQPRC